jgi:hypothetical protein
MFKRARFANAMLLLSAALVMPVHADVSTRVRILDSINPASFTGAFETRDKSDPSVVTDTLTRDDAFSLATSFASANLATGELKVNATGIPRQFFHNGAFAQATATATDVLTIVGPDSTAIPIAILLTVDGTLSTPSASAGAGTAFSFVRGGLSVDGPAAIETAELQRRTVYDAAGIISGGELTALRDWAGAAPLPGTDQYELVLRHEAMVVPNVGFDFLSEIFVSATYTASGPTAPLPGAQLLVDFGNTAIITVELPSGYSLESASGVFLTTPIPEASTWSMILAGLGLLAIAHLRRRTS